MGKAGKSRSVVVYPTVSDATTLIDCQVAIKVLRVLGSNPETNSLRVRVASPMAEVDDLKTLYHRNGYDVKWWYGANCSIEISYRCTAFTPRKESSPPSSRRGMQMGISTITCVREMLT